MKLRPLLGWAIVIYSVFYVAWSLMRAYGFSAGIGASVLELVVLFVICVVAGSSLKFKTWKDILPYSIGWAIIAALIDALFAAPTGQWTFFSQPSTWISYALVAVFPLFAVFVRKQHSHSGIWET
jgi:hypothetical protein